MILPVIIKRLYIEALRRLSKNAKRRQVKALHTLRDPKCLNQFDFNLHSLHLPVGYVANDLST